ncbi:hypothetical protein BH09VER1_BH09VER1_46710 [soil metagenome]
MSEPPPTFIPTPPPVPVVTEGDATGGVIPYKNPQALLAYYLGIFGLFPLVGLLLAIPAIVLGVIGLKKRKANPIIKGSVHAWIGIVLGAVSTIYNSLFLVLLLFAVFSKH